ncbi:MAG: CBS domain-containing protein [Anaerolineae bacterium]|nr:CBS domain-containing protein [Anaerolineae bacterium]
MLKVKEIMTTDVVTIQGSAPVAEAIELMKEKKLRDLIVEPRSVEDAYGIITETDIVYKIAAYGKDPQEVRVHEIMTKPCIVVNPDLSVEHAARLFAHFHLRRAPVIKGKLLGIVSVTDILRQAMWWQG